MVVEFLNNDVALLGEFNDTPDECSLNTLESDIYTPMSIESEKEGFLIKLTESLASTNHVSYRLKRLDKMDSIINLVNAAILGSSLENLDNYSSDSLVKKALYGQILITPGLKSRLYQSASSTLTAQIVIPPYLKIESLLPGPIGIYSGNETIKLKICINLLNKTSKYTYKGSL
jgi:hypothetical protein